MCTGDHCSLAIPVGERKSVSEDKVVLESWKAGSAAVLAQRITWFKTGEYPHDTPTLSITPRNSPTRAVEERNQSTEKSKSVKKPRGPIYLKSLVPDSATLYSAYTRNDLAAQSDLPYYYHLLEASVDGYCSKLDGYPTVPALAPKSKFLSPYVAKFSRQLARVLEINQDLLLRLVDMLRANPGMASCQGQSNRRIITLPHYIYL